MTYKKLIPSIFGSWILKKYPNMAIKEIAYSLGIARCTLDRWLILDANRIKERQIEQMIINLYRHSGQSPEQTRNELNELIRNS